MFHMFLPNGKNKHNITQLKKLTAINCPLLISHLGKLLTYLFNIYLAELDDYVMEILSFITLKQKARKPNMYM